MLIYLTTREQIWLHKLLTGLYEERDEIVSGSMPDVLMVTHLITRLR